MRQIAANLRRYHPRHPLPVELAAMTLPQLLDAARDLADGVFDRDLDALRGAF